MTGCARIVLIVVVAVGEGVDAVKKPEQQVDNGIEVIARLYVVVASAPRNAAA